MASAARASCGHQKYPHASACASVKLPDENDHRADGNAAIDRYFALRPAGELQAPQAERSADIVNDQFRSAVGSRYSIGQPESILGGGLVAVAWRFIGVVVAWCWRRSRSKDGIYE